MPKTVWVCRNEFTDMNIERIKRLSYINPEAVTCKRDKPLRGWTEITAEHRRATKTLEETVMDFFQ